MSKHAAAVKAATEAARAATESVARLERQLQALDADMASGGRGFIALAAAGARYEDALAAAALGEGSSKDVAEAKAALDEAHRLERQESQDAGRRESALIGLRRRMEQAQAQQVAAQAAQVEAQAMWVQAQLEEADAEYLDTLVRAYDAYLRRETARKWLTDAGREVRSLHGYYTGASQLRDAAMPLGPASLRAAEQVHGGAQDGANLRFLPRVDFRDTKARFELELEALSGDVPDAAPGVVASLKRSTRSAAAAVSGLVALVGSAMNAPGTGS